MCTRLDRGPSARTFSWCFRVLLCVLSVATLAPPAAVAAQLTLTWTDNSGGEAGFAIERKQGTTGSFGEIGQQSPGVTSFIDSGLTSAATYCYRVRAYNLAGYSDYSNEACGTTSQAIMEVSVTKAGAGGGTVTSSPAGISCGADCSETYNSRTAVTLTATPLSGSTFSGWSGVACAGTGPCTLSGNASVAVTATFVAAPRNSYTLSVRKMGRGRISSSPVGIKCGSGSHDCSEAYTADTRVILTATPRSGWTFRGWSGGGCTGKQPCTLTLSANTSVTATFTK
jgi:Divergent InlB B-repeat domain